MKHRWHQNTLTVPGGYIHRRSATRDDVGYDDWQERYAGSNRQSPPCYYSAVVWVESDTRRTRFALPVGHYITVQEAKARVAEFNRARRNLHTDRTLHN